MLNDYYPLTDKICTLIDYDECSICNNSLVGGQVNLIHISSVSVSQMTNVETLYNYSIRVDWMENIVLYTPITVFESSYDEVLQNICWDVFDKINSKIYALFGEDGYIMLSLNIKPEYLSKETIAQGMKMIENTVKLYRKAIEQYGYRYR